MPTSSKKAAEKSHRRNLHLQRSRRAHQDRTRQRTRDDLRLRPGREPNLRRRDQKAQKSRRSKIPTATMATGCARPKRSPAPPATWRGTWPKSCRWSSTTAPTATSTARGPAYRANQQHHQHRPLPPSRPARHHTPAHRVNRQNRSHLHLRRIRQPTGTPAPPRHRLATTGSTPTPTRDSSTCGRENTTQRQRNS